MDGLVKSLKNSKNSPLVKKAIGTRKGPALSDDAEGVVKCSDKLDKRFARTKISSRKSPNKQSQLAWTSARDISPNYTTKEFDRVSDEGGISENKGCAKAAAAEPPTRKGKEVRRHPKQNSTVRANAQKVRPLATAKSRTKSVSPSRRKTAQGKRMKISFDQKEWALRHNKYGRAADAVSPKGFPAGGTSKVSKKLDNAESLSESGFTSDSVRPLCTPNHIHSSFSSVCKLSNESSAVYPLESMESMATISDRIFVSDSFPASCATDFSQGTSFIDVQDSDILHKDDSKELKENLNGQKPQAHIKSANGSSFCSIAQADPEYKVRDVNDDQNVDLIKDSRHSVKELGGAPLGISDTEVKHHPITTRHATDGAAKERCGDVRARPGKKYVSRSSEEHHCSFQSNLERCQRVRKVNSIDGDGNMLDEVHAADQPFSVHGRSQSSKGTVQKRKSTELFKVHVHAQNIHSTRMVSPKSKTSLKSAKDLSKSNGGDAALRKKQFISHSRSAGRDSVIKARLSLRPDAQTDTAKEACANNPTCKISDVHKYASRTSPRQFVASKQKQFTSSTTQKSRPKPNYTQGFVDTKLCAAVKSRSYLVSEKYNSDKATKSNKVTSFDQPRESPKTSNPKHRQSPRSMLLRGRDRAYEVNAGDCYKDKSSPEKKSRFASKSVVPNKCQTDVSSEVQLRSAPNRSEPVSLKPAGQRLSQNKPTSSASVVKIRSSRGDGHSEKRNSGASLVITPLYGSTSQNATPAASRNGPKFADNPSHGNESCNKSTESIMLIANMQLQKIKALTCRKPAITPRLSRASMLKSKSMLDQGRQLEIAKTKRARSVEPREGRASVKGSHEDIPAGLRSPIVLKAVQIFPRGAITKGKASPSAWESRRAENLNKHTHTQPALKENHSSCYFNRLMDSTLKESMAPVAIESKLREATVPVHSVHIRHYPSGVKCRSPDNAASYCRHAPNVVSLRDDAWPHTHLHKEFAKKKGGNVRVKKRNCNVDIQSGVAALPEKETDKKLIPLSSVLEARNVTNSFAPSAFRHRSQDIISGDPGDFDFSEAHGIDAVESKQKLAIDFDERKLFCVANTSPPLKNDEADSGGDDRPSPRLRRCRRATASLGEINLLATGLDSLADNDAENIVNVRKIDFEPMICIPLADSDSLPKANHQDTGTDCQSFFAQNQSTKYSPTTRGDPKSAKGIFKSPAFASKMNFQGPEMSEELSVSRVVQKMDPEFAQMPVGSLGEMAVVNQEMIDEVTPGYLVPITEGKDVSECDTVGEMIHLVQQDCVSANLQSDLNFEDSTANDAVLENKSDTLVLSNFILRDDVDIWSNGESPLGIMPVALSPANSMDSVCSSADDVTLIAGDSHDTVDKCNIMDTEQQAEERLSLITERDQGELTEHHQTCYSNNIEANAVSLGAPDKDIEPEGRLDAASFNSPYGVNDSPDSTSSIPCKLPERVDYEMRDDTSQESLVSCLCSQIPSSASANLDQTSNHHLHDMLVDGSPEKGDKNSSTRPSFRDAVDKGISPNPPFASLDFIFQSEGPLCDQLITPSCKRPTVPDKGRVDVSELQQLYESLSSDGGKKDKKDPKSMAEPLKSSSRATGKRNALDTASSCESTLSMLEMDFSSLASRPPSSVAESKVCQRSTWKHHVSGGTSRMDLSTDSFNSLFIENAMYLQCVTAERKDEEGCTRAGAQRRLKGKKLSFHKKSKEEDKKRSNPRLLSSVQPKKTAPDSQDTTTRQGAQTSAQQNSCLEDQFSPNTECPSVQEPESPTLCLSDITGCNVTRSSVTECLKSGGGRAARLKVKHPLKLGRDECAGRSGIKPHQLRVSESGSPKKGSESESLSINCAIPCGHKPSPRSQEPDGWVCVTNEELDPGVVRSKVDEMEALRRRRFLERTTEVTSDDSKSWRSRIYQKDNADEPSLSRREKAESRRAELPSQNEDSDRGSSFRRRRGGEESTSSELAERLARRRAQRLEEQGESSSVDGSVEGSRLSSRRWSRDGSVRSIESSESGDADTGFTGRRTRRSDAESAFVNNNGSSKETMNRPVDSRSEDVDENGEAAHVTLGWHSRRKETGDARPSHWDSRDSANGVSLSSDAGDAYVMGKPGVQRRSGDSASFEEEPALSRKSRSLQRTSKDSAFSESVENGDDDLTTNANNSNNNSSTQDVFLRESPSSSLTYRARRIQEYIQDCENTGPVFREKPTIPNGTQAHSEQAQIAAGDVGQTSSPSRGQGQPTAVASSQDRDDDEESSLNGNVERGNGESEDMALAGFKARLLRLRGVEADDTKDGAADTNSSVEVVANFGITTTQDELLQDSQHPGQLSDFGGPTGNVDNNAEVPADAPPEVEKKGRRRRVDKSALRKSPLNMSAESSDMTEETQHSDSNQEDGKPRRRTEGSVVSQHASFWENPSSQHAPAPARARTNIPTRYMGDLSAKISATRQKFNQASAEPDKSSAAAGPRSKVDAAADVHLKTKKVDLGQLIQKFSSSGSESNSERSDADAEPPGPAGHRPFVRRQKAEEIHSSSEESEGARRTPERTQSLKAYTKQVSGGPASVEKSSSFRSDFMNRRLAQKTSGSISALGQSKEATPPSKEATPPPKEATSLSKDTAHPKTLAAAINSESKTKHPPGALTAKTDEPTVAHSKSDQRSTLSSTSSQEPSVASSSGSRRTAYTYERRTVTVSPEKDSLLPSRPSTDPKLTDYELSALKNRAWLSGMSSRRATSGAPTTSADKAKEETATQNVTLSGSFNDLASGAPIDHNKTSGMTTLDKSLELLSKVTEELDHPERPSSLPTSPLDLKSPGAKAKSPSFEEAHKYIQDVQTSIRTISSRGSPEKTKSPGSAAQASFTFPLPGQAKVVPEPERPVSRRAARDLKSLERDVVAGARPTDTESGHAQRDRKSAERDSKSTEREAKSVERVSRAVAKPTTDNHSEDNHTHTTRTSATPASERGTKGAPLAQDQVTPMSTLSATSTTGSDDVSKAQPTPDPIPASRSPIHTRPDVPPGPSSSSSFDAMSGMKRSSSFKDPSELNERRKGILKRATSLRSKEESTGAPILDPQLAKILHQRKQIVEDVLEEEDERDRKRTMSATEEIQENLKYSKQKAAEQGRDPEEDEALRSLSVAERIQYMQTKLEEERYSAVTSRSRSGMSTPRSRPVSELITPTQFKYDDPHQPHMSTSSSASSISALALVPGSGGVAPLLAAARSREDSVSSSSGSADVARQPLPLLLSSSSAVVGSTLIEKLTVIAESGEAFQERRHRFQQRSRNDWRHQTQPVTLEEISAADCLEAVSAFRALVRKKTSINAFDQLRDQGATKPAPPLGGKKAEFPQHLSPSPKNQRRGRRLRHRTLPVTAEELNAVPENQMLVMNPEWVKTEDVDDKRDSKADSGILSGSDADLQSGGGPGADPDSGDREPSKMTISARASFFRGLEEKSKAELREKSASGAKRYIMRKKRERSQTMPVTDDELMNASEMGEKGSSGGVAAAATESSRTAQSESRSRSTSISEDGEGQHEEDELTKLSLSEKVKLFSQTKDKEQQPPPKAEAPVKRRGRKQPSRFSTQPVTSEEVEQAAAYSRISPLAMSLVKPPDPDILKGLPLKDQRQLMAQHAEMFLSQSSLRSMSRSGSNTSISQPSSRRASVTLEQEEGGAAGDKKPEAGEEEKNERRGILKDKSASTKELHEIKGILRSEPVKVLSEPEVHSILKGSWESHHPASSAEPRGILKKAKSEDIPTADPSEDARRPLRHVDSDEEDKPGKPRSRSNSQPFGILKRDPSPQPNDHEIKGILKTPSHENVPHLTSAMRRGSNDSDSSSVLKSALRHRGHNSDSEEGHHEVTHPAQELKSAMHKPHAPNAGDKMDDANSHIHVDLTLAISGVDDARSTFRQPHSRSPGSSSSAPHASDWSSLDRGDEGRSTASGAAASSPSTFPSGQAPEEKSTLKVPEDDPKTAASASEGEGESSAGELLDEPRTNRLRKKSRMNRDTNSERYKTQPPELADGSASSASEPAKRKYKYEARHKTQPITQGEMMEAESAAPATNLNRTPGGSISDRLNQLKTSGNEEWKKRVERKDDIMVVPEVVKLREQAGMRIPRPTSIADRLSELEVSKKTWQNRVEESDAKQFTVAAKLANNVVDSPLVNKLKSLPKKEGDGISPVSSPVTPTKEFIAKIPLPKDIVHDPLAKIEPVKRESESEDKKEPVRVEVPDVGEEMQAFFNVKSISEIPDKVEMTIDDLNDIFIEAENILTSVHKIKPQRKQKPSTHNPLKNMKVETVNEYHEVTLGVAEKEMRRVKREGLAKDAGFAEAALAGLASKENFKQVELRRTDSGSTAHGVALEPFKDLMLFHVKGRRTVQTRLVEPHARSVNSGDSYLLVTPDKVIHWEGQYANVIEKAKANEIASCIQTKKEMGCKRANEVIMVYQSKDHYGNGKQFWSSLEGERQCQECGPDNEDELYEASVVKSNMIYRLEGNALLPYTEYWGDLPKYEMLQKNEVIVFDFGSEFYLWQGKSVGMEQRKLGLKLAKQLFEKGYDYTESAINPLSPLRTEEHGGLPLKADKRPSWVIFGKVNQNMETILFREKFADWPDASRIIGVKGLDPTGAENNSKDQQELKPHDATLMLPLNTSPVTLKLEGSDLGRGVKWAEDMQGFVKEQEIITINVTTWHVLEYGHSKLPPASHGQFHEGDTYVVRWQYMVASANLRNVKGLLKNIPKGRERCAYFFWQGSSSTINEKGASALMTVELDEERGPQVRVLQGKELPCFLNLYNGKMVVHIGKREDSTTCTQGAWRLYCLRGDYENEACLVEIPVSINHLRSKSSLVLLNVNTGIVYIWHGTKSPKHIRELVRKTVGKIQESPPLEFSFHKSAVLTITEVEEGEEKKEIWAALDSRDRDSYHSLLKDPRPYTHTIRLFHMSSVNMVFEVHEQLNPSRVPDLTTPYPFLQSDLYKATQPALFLVDNEHEVFLWQGWFPVSSQDTDNVITGSATARFNMDRICAMETTLHYCKVKNPAHPPTAYLVCAGVEPECFTTLFPVWVVDTVVQDISVEEGKTQGYKEKVSDVLHRLTKTKYTLAELQERPLPEGVDPLKLESYLEDEEFEEILGMNREEFYGNPIWKQKQLKQHAKLF